MAAPTIFADFTNADEHGRVRLTCVGTTRDLSRLSVRLVDGLRVVLNDHEELEADGEVVYSTDEHIWVAKVDWNAIRRFSQSR